MIFKICWQLLHGCNEYESAEKLPEVLVIVMFHVQSAMGICCSIRTSHFCWCVNNWQLWCPQWKCGTAACSLKSEKCTVLLMETTHKYQKPDDTKQWAKELKASDAGDDTSSVIFVLHDRLIAVSMMLWALLTTHFSKDVDWSSSECWWWWAFLMRGEVWRTQQKSCVKTWSCWLYSSSINGDGSVGHTQFPEVNDLLLGLADVGAQVVSRSLAVPPSPCRLSHHWCLFNDGVCVMPKVGWPYCTSSFPWTCPLFRTLKKHPD